MIIGTIGNGFVGKALQQLKCGDIEILSYDINPDSCDPKGTIIGDLNACELIFISVPTPMDRDGSCYTNIISSVLTDLKHINYNGHIVIRSTVPVGTCDELQCHFMPEFLTEKNYMFDFANNKNWFFGLLNNEALDSGFISKITKLFQLAHANTKIVHNNLHFMMNKECEMIKLFRNTFLATKISFCNEISEFCDLKRIDYETVRKFATMDERISTGHSFVPGHDGLKGFGGTCFPKDIASLHHEIKLVGMKSYIINSVIERKDKVDRPQKDWSLDKGRAVV